MKFKDLLESDNEAVLELEEFGQYSIIDGVILKTQIVLWTDKISAREDKNYVGLRGDYLTAYFKTADYCRKRERIPRQGEWVHVNGKRYEVQSCQDELGVTTLTTKTYRQETRRVYNNYK